MTTQIQPRDSSPAESTEKPTIQNIPVPSPSEPTPTPVPSSRWTLNFWTKPPAVPELLRRNHAAHFTGRWHYTLTGRVRYPHPVDPETATSSTHPNDPYDTPGITTKTPSGKYLYLNEFHQPTTKYNDVAVYLSPTRSAPRRLVVQATRQVLTSAAVDGGDWVRTNISGNVPAVLRLAEWALSPMREPGFWNKVDGAVRMVVAAVPIQVMMAVPGLSTFDDEEWSDSYTDFRGYYWNWPKWAVNELDRRPGSGGMEGKGLEGGRVDYRVRAQRPRRLVVKGVDGGWRLKVVEEGDEVPSYVFVSYVWGHFVGDEGRERLKGFAAQIAEGEGCEAFWYDQECAVQFSGEETDYDIYTMADTIRGASRVAVLLGDDSLRSRQEWGARLWTLPEGLLAPGSHLLLCHEDMETKKLRQRRIHKVELTGRLWGSSSGRSDLAPGEAETRLLAEHFSGLLTLSRLELLPAAISALSARTTSNDFTGADLAYAAMGLLHYRIPKPAEPRDTKGQDEAILFESLARLSLQNDSDKIIERMLCLLPPPSPGPVPWKPIFETLSTPDQFGTMLHHTTPLCDVVGVCDEPQTVMIDNCRVMHIRWKNFPRPVTERSQGLRNILAAFFVTAGLVWITWGIQLAIAYFPFWVIVLEGNDSESARKRVLIAWVVAFFLFVGLLLSTFSPFAVKGIFGGQVVKSSPELVGFEGVMPIDKLEKLIFGYVAKGGTLSYAASGTPLQKDYRDKLERAGVEPDWVRNPEAGAKYLPSPMHRFFTLVDMGERTVSIFAAERPPTVALLCGREGGMLRAVLCSWRFENDCLYKETVVRMPSSVYEAATPKAWLKLCLKSQNQAQRWRAGWMPQH